MTFLKLAIIILFFVVIAVYEVRRLVNEKLYRELWAFSFLLLLALALTISYSLGFRIKLPQLPG